MEWEYAFGYRPLDESVEQIGDSIHPLVTPVNGMVTSLGREVLPSYSPLLYFTLLCFGGPRPVNSFVLVE